MILHRKSALGFDSTTHHSITFRATSTISNKNGLGGIAAARDPRIVQEALNPRF